MLTPLHLAHRVRKGLVPFACVKETSGAITHPPRQSWTLNRVRTANARFGVGYHEGCAGCATWLGGPLSCGSHRIHAVGGFPQSSTDLRLLALDEAVDLVESRRSSILRDGLRSTESLCGLGGPVRDPGDVATTLGVNFFDLVLTTMEYSDGDDCDRVWKEWV